MQINIKKDVCFHLNCDFTKVDMIMRTMIMYASVCFLDANFASVTIVSQ